MSQPPQDVRDAPARLPVEKTETRFEGHVAGMRTDTVRFDDGSSAERDYVVHPGAVGVVALDPDDRVLLLRQYRHPVQRMLWEPPAGICDVPGEPPLETAKRELFEEAHTRADRWDLLTDSFTTPGGSDEALRIFLARDLSAAEGDRFQGIAEEADMPISWVPLDEAADKVLAGDLHNPTAVIGILAAKVARDAGWAGLRPADAVWPEKPDGAGSKA